jgi:hypothetical protein
VGKGVDKKKYPNIYPDMQMKIAQNTTILFWQTHETGSVQSASQDQHRWPSRRIISPQQPLESTLHSVYVSCRFLKQLRRNRDEEAKLMANVPGWEVGTWYGEPVYKTLPPDTLVVPNIFEFYAQGPQSELNRRIMIKYWS